MEPSASETLANNLARGVEPAVELTSLERLSAHVKQVPVLRHVKRKKLRSTFENGLRQLSCTPPRLGVNDKRAVGNRSDEFVAADS